MRGRIAGALFVAALAGLIHAGEAEAKIPAAQAAAIQNALTGAETSATLARRRYNECSNRNDVTPYCLGAPATAFLRSLKRLESALSAARLRQPPRSTCREQLSERVAETHTFWAALESRSRMISPELGRKWLETVKVAFRLLLEKTMTTITLCQRR